MADSVNHCYITACQNGELEKVKAALVLGCDVNYSDTKKPHLTGLIIAAGSGDSHLPILTTILQTQGVDVNKTSKGNNTALMMACIAGNLGGVALLCGAPGIDTNIQNIHGATAAMCCVIGRDNADCLAELLRIPGVNINLKSNAGCAAIHWAVMCNSLECLKILLQTDTVDVNMKNSAGNTAAMLCLIENKKDMFKVMMESAKVDLSIKNAKDKTLEKIARKKSDIEALKLLSGTMMHRMETLVANMRNMQMQMRRSKECPVCMDELVPNRALYQCNRGHIICGNCKPRIQQCPKCRGPMMGRAYDFEEFLAGN